MAIPAPRNLKIGTIIDKTLGVLELSLPAVLIFVGGLSAINTAVKYFTLEMTAPTQQLVIGLLSFVVSVIAGYVLLEAMLRRTGLRSREGEAVFFSYLGLSILYTLGVMVGFLIIIFPGLYIMARWSIAQPMIVARGEGVMQTLGESWERTKGNEFQILVAAIALIVPLVAIMIAGGIFLDAKSLPGIGISQLATSALSVALTGMGVALYGLIVGRDEVATAFT
jgi:hypothetical protein